MSASPRKEVVESGQEPIMKRIYIPLAEQSGNRTGETSPDIFISDCDDTAFQRNFEAAHPLIN